MNRQERLSRLVDLVIEQGSVRLEDLVDHLGVSPATVRRDLDDLADQQLVIRTRGGASANPSTGEVPLRYRTAKQSLEKQAIARCAAAMVNPGDVIGFNGGTTTTAAAHELGVRIAGDPAFGHDSITVVTNAVNIANDLTIRPQARVVVTGGVARTRSYELIGPLAHRILPYIRIDTLFLGINAITSDGGVYSDSEEEASITGALVEASQRTIVVADSSKIGATAFAWVCGLDKVASLITDVNADPDGVARLETAGVEVILAR